MDGPFDLGYAANLLNNIGTALGGLIAGLGCLFPNGELQAGFRIRYCIPETMENIRRISNPRFFFYAPGMRLQSIILFVTPGALSASS